MSDYQTVRDHRKMESAGDMTIEPMPTSPAPASPAPEKTPMSKIYIGPLRAPNPNKHATSRQAHPDDIARPAYTGTVKT